MLMSYQEENDLLRAAVSDMSESKGPDTSSSRGSSRPVGAGKASSGGGAGSGGGSRVNKGQSRVRTEVRPPTPPTEEEVRSAGSVTGVFPSVEEEEDEEAEEME
jgi:hypothetical protein